MPNSHIYMFKSQFCLHLVDLSSCRQLFLEISKSQVITNITRNKSKMPHPINSSMMLCFHQLFDSFSINLNGIGLAMTCCIGIVGNFVGCLIVVRRYLKNSVFRFYLIGLCISDTGKDIKKPYLLLTLNVGGKQLNRWCTQMTKTRFLTFG